FALGNLKDKIGLLHLFSLNPHKAMVQYDRLKGNRPKEYTFSNPKIDQAEELAVHLVENSKRTVYFTEDADVAKKTIIKISLRIPTKIHALCLSDSIVFYQAGKPLKKGVVNKNTKLQNFMLEELKDEEILKNLSRSGLSQVEIDDRMRRVAREEDEIGEEDVTWAVKTVKEFIAKNNQVATMVANSSYSRGFNLQQFNAVVHLDRDGWDSEELKQRTARLQGVEKEEPVTEYILDAVVGGSTSIDELRDRVQEVDQKFFSEILRESGALDLTKKYEAIEKLTTSKKVNLENFTRALLPTREMLAKIEEREKGLREDPIKYTQLDPNRFNHPSMENLSEHEKEMLDLTGFTGITNIASEHIKFRLTSDRENEMKSVGDWITTLHGTDRRKYYGENYIWNDAFTTNYCAPNGLGTHVLFSQLVAVKKAKLDAIACLGAGSFNSFDPETGEAKGQNYIGYYVWPKFGYNAEVLLNLDQIEEFANIFAKMVSQKLKWTEAITDGVKPIAPDPLDVGERPYKENYELDLDIEELMTNSGSSEERKQLQLKAILAS
ncbi:hypothetical protein EBU71_17685, partial [bacterium]|nr:hypothetical protein [Candidatus Elulimicrobium humile]